MNVPCGVPVHMNDSVQSLCLLLPQTLDEMKLEIKPVKIDRRLTGSSFIDEPLQQVSYFCDMFEGAGLCYGHGSFLLPMTHCLKQKID